jgi:hypothetical protein
MKPGLSAAESQVELLQQSVRRLSEIVDSEKNKSAGVFNALVPILCSILGAVFGLLGLLGIRLVLK